LARQEHPELYEAIRASDDHVSLVLRLWERSELFLELSSEFRDPSSVVRSWTYDPANLEEITTRLGGSGASGRD
jgi:hypothetical protein